MFREAFVGKKVLVTGHTGFKGAWLTTWLLKLGASVIGVSRDVPTNPSMFEELNVESRIVHHLMDVRELSAISNIIDEHQPDYVFHLAAQAIVSSSYNDPVDTITTNAIGTMNMLESLRLVRNGCIAIFVTSDKCYDNVEWEWGYRETDALGGKDIYSGSKGAAELIIKSYAESFFSQDEHPVRVAVGRAGNVIGAGKWAKERIVDDCKRAWSNGLKADVRSPNATRPWQHVLEPLSGYLTLAADLRNNKNLKGHAFNFGPPAGQNHTVINLLSDLATLWGFKSVDEAFSITDNTSFNEAGLLRLNCDKALFHLKWEATLNYAETINFICDWYKDYYLLNGDVYDRTMQQISDYENFSSMRKRVWSLKN